MQIELLGSNGAIGNAIAKPAPNRGWRLQSEFHILN
jgi:hypothetical protein